MNGLPYYKAYPRDFVEGTIGMPFELKGAYRLILDLIYMQGGKLPDDPRYISGLLGCSIRKWKSLRDQLVSLDKIQVSGEFLSNYRAVSELETLAKLQDTKRENRAGYKKNKDLQKRPSDHTEPEPDISIERGKPLSCAAEQREGVEGDLFQDPPVPQQKAEPDRFEEFWQVYPHRGGTKTGKKPAKARWDVKRRQGIEQQTMIDGALRWQRHPKTIRGYAPDPATWLNQELWTDEIGEDNVLPMEGRGQRAEDKQAAARAINRAAALTKHLPESW